MFSLLDILLGAAGVLVALGISAPFLMLRHRPARAARFVAAPASVGRPTAAAVARELQKQAS
jgi:hypothetical protein